jgi:hypothetical protein
MGKWGMFPASFTRMAAFGLNLSQNMSFISVAEAGLQESHHHNLACRLLYGSAELFPIPAFSGLERLT